MSRISKAAKLGQSGLLLGIATAAATTLFGAQAASAASPTAAITTVTTSIPRTTEWYDPESDAPDSTAENSDEGSKAADSQDAQDPLIWDGAAAAAERNWTTEDTQAIEAWKAEHPDAVEAWQADHENAAE